MINLSAVVISKNAQDLIEDCLDSLSFCDEIVVIDAGSTDKTLEIVEKRGAKIFNHELEDFSAIRNLGKEKAQGKWIFYVDVDERVTPELSRNIKEVVKDSNSEIVAYKLQRKNFYLGKNEWPYIEKLERLFLKEKLKNWEGKIHETASVDGKIGQLDGFLLHYTHRDLTSMVNKTIEWSKIEAELRFNSNHPKMTWWRFPRVIITGFLNSYVKQKGYKVGVVGVIESVYQAFSMFITYARLWELQKQKELKK